MSCSFWREKERKNVNSLLVDCCAAVDHSARFDEVFNQRVPWAVNRINTGAMIECCENRGCGCSEGDLGAEHSVCS